MRSLWRSLKPVRYDSTIRCASTAIAGVSYTIRRMSMGRRIKLAEAIRDLAQEFEFREAGDGPEDQVEAAVLAARINRSYLQWGLVELSGLLVDGEPPTPDILFERGPEALLQEIAVRVKAECGLKEDERKN